MRTKYIVALVLSMLFCRVSVAQDIGAKQFSAYVNEEPSSQPLQFGAVKNIKTGEVSLTDGDGFFTISGSIGDTLRFHSLGYRDTTWVIPGIWYTMDENIRLNVQPNIYSLNEVEVVRYYSYAHFKQAFKDLRLPEDEKEKAREKINSWAFDNAIAWGKSNAVAARGTFGVGISIGGEGKAAKQRNAVNKMEEIQEKSKRYNHFVSRDNIMQLTNYKGTCLDSFMVFLNTGYALNYQMPEYELLSRILMASANFKNLKGSQEWFLDSLDVNM